MRRKIFIVLCLVFGGISVCAYMSPKTIDVEPTRVLLKNSYGNVVLDHKIHTELYGVDCVACHDAMIDITDENKMQIYHDLCMGCHEDYGVGPYTNEQCNQCHLPQTS